MSNISIMLQGDTQDPLKGASLYDLIQVSLNNHHRPDLPNSKPSDSIMLNFFQEALKLHLHQPVVSDMTYDSLTPLEPPMPHIQTPLLDSNITPMQTEIDNRNYTEPLLDLQNLKNLDQELIIQNKFREFAESRTPPNLEIAKAESEPLQPRSSQQQFTPKNDQRLVGSQMQQSMFVPVRANAKSKERRVGNAHQFKTIEIQEQRKRIKDSSVIKERPQKTPRDKSRLKSEGLTRVKSTRDNMRMGSDTSLAQQKIMERLEPIYTPEKIVMTKRTEKKSVNRTQKYTIAKKPFVAENESCYSLGSSNQPPKTLDKRSSRSNVGIKKMGASIKYEQPLIKDQRLITLRNQQIISKFSRQPTKKQQMNQALSKLNISVLQEFQRIKKPQKQALIIGKLFCTIFCTFRDPPLDESYTFDRVTQEFDYWDGIQYFLLTNPNKVLAEAALIKSRVPNRKLVNEPFAKSLLKLLADNESQLKNVPNTNMKTIFDLVQKTLIYVEHKHFNKKKRLSQVKGINPNNEDLVIVSSDSLSSQAPYQSQEEEEEDLGDDMEATLLNEVQISSLSQQQLNQALTTNPQILNTEERFAELSETGSRLESHFSSNNNNPSYHQYIQRLKHNYAVVGDSPPRAAVKSSPAIKHKFSPATQQNTEKQSFIETKADKIVSEINQLPQSESIYAGASQNETTVINLPLQVQVLSERHSKKSSVQFNLEPAVEIQPPLIKQKTSNTESPDSAYNSRKHSSPKKSAESSPKKLSPTQKLIKFKTNAHKQQIMQHQLKQVVSADELPRQYFYDQLPQKRQQPYQQQPNHHQQTQQLTNLTMPRSIESYKPPIVSIQNQQAQTPKSGSSQSQQSTKQEYQIQVMNRDIFSYEESDETHRIQVYESESEESSFQLKLLPVQELSSNRSSLLSKREIDMKTIEELKRRRLETRENGTFDMKEKRDEIIKRIQSEFIK